MREIKFRGKCIPEFPHPVAKWVYGSFVSDKLILSPYKERNENRHFWYMVDPDTVGQYTGLKDADGREIYEGDVVRHENCICLVVYNSTRFASFALRKDGWAFDHYFGEAFEASECQVIGNVHDNPNLLEVEHD